MTLPLQASRSLAVGTPHALTFSAYFVSHTTPHGDHSRMGAVVNVTWGSPSLDQIEELVNESLEALDELHSMPADHPLRILAAQCRAAVVASRRLSFGPFAQRALTEKALRVKVDALLFLRSQLAQERLASGTIPKGTRAWPEDDRDELEKSATDPFALPSDHV